MKGGWVYIMTNKPGGVLYIGVCAEIVARVAQHREGKGSAFCKRYNLTRLVYVEAYPTIDEAIRREKAMKEWHRAWKRAADRGDEPRLGRSLADHPGLGASAHSRHPGEAGTSGR